MLQLLFVVIVKEKDDVETITVLIWKDIIYNCAV